MMFVQWYDLHRDHAIHFSGRCLCRLDDNDHDVRVME